MNRLLAFYTFLFGFEMLHGCLRYSGLLLNKYFVHFTGTHALAWLLYGPVIYVYVRYAITKKKFQQSDFLFLIPPLVIFALNAPFYFNGAQKKLEILSNNAVSEYSLFPSYGMWIVIGFLFFYGILTYRTYRTHNTLGFQENSWLKYFVGSYIAFAFLFFSYIFLIEFELMDPKFDYFIDAGILFFVGLVGYFGFVQPDLFNGLKTIREIIPFVKYKNTGLSKGVAEDLKDKLHRLMENDKPYLRNDLRLNDLAALLNVSRHHTSQIINEYFNLSFFDFINKYRVEDAKDMLRQYNKDDLNINQIAYSVGFNNRASFYKAFKKFTNETPLKFANHLRVS